MNLELEEKSIFNDMIFEVYTDEEDEIYMTSEQLGEVLGYNNPRVAINKIINRNDYLKDDEFSGTTKLVSTDGKAYNKRVLTEDGIYEVTILSKQPKAREFRMHIRKLLKSLRIGEVEIQRSKTTKDILVERAGEDSIERAYRYIEELERKRQEELK